MAQLKNLIVEGDTRLIGDTNAGNVTATTIKKSGGTSSQFLKADGSVDSNSYATTSQIPTVNNATLTIQKNGTTVNSFTANASSNVTANITVPTKVSELTNDSGYTTNTGTITGVKMNGSTVASSGVADLGTVITSHQSIKTVNSNSLTGSGNVSVGTVTSVATGVGLTGGSITSTGTIKAKLKEETLNTADSARSTSTSGGLYSVEADKSGNLAVRVPWTDHTYTVNNGTFAVKGAGTQVSSTSANASSNTSVDIVAGSNVTVTPDATNSKITIAATDTTYSNATQSAAGLMSSTDKTKLDGVAIGATANIGTVTSIKVNNTTYLPVGSTGLITLADYPTVNDKTLTIQKNGTNVATFTANSSSDVTANISVPTTPADIGAAAGNHTHTTTLAADTGTSSITLSNGGKYKLTAGGNSVIFTMPAGAGSDIYWATYDSSTYSDIKDALDAGKVVLMKHTDTWGTNSGGTTIFIASYHEWMPAPAGDSRIYFAATDGVVMIETYVTQNDVWAAIDSYELEDSSRKNSSIISSNKSSTLYYASTKAVYDYVGRNAAGRYSCTKSGGSGVTSLFCCNGNLVCYGSSTSFSGTFTMTVSNFYAAFMKSIGGYTLDNEALSDTNKVTELAYLMTNSSITKLAAGSGSNTRYEFSYQSINGGTGTPTGFTYGASASGCRIAVSTSGVTLTIV